MSDNANYRKERVERLLQKLKCEVSRGMMEGDLEEWIGFSFYVPTSKTIEDGVVHCEFRTRPEKRYMMNSEDIEPRFKVIK